MAGAEHLSELDSLDVSVAVGGTVSIRREGNVILFEVGASGVTWMRELGPDEAEEIALGLLVAARRARKESR